MLHREGTLKKAWHHGWGESVTTGKVATRWPRPPYADVDGDGKLELMVSMFNGNDKLAWETRIYDVLTGDGILSELGPRLADLLPSRRAFVVYDDKLPEAFVASAVAGLAAFAATVVIVYQWREARRARDDGR